MIDLILYDYETDYVQKNRRKETDVAAICVNLYINGHTFIHTKWLDEQEYDEWIDDEELHDNLIDEAWAAAGEHLLPMEVILVKRRGTDDQEAVG